jgi:hypothetical protein
LGKNFGKVPAARYSFGSVIADACGSRPLMDVSILVGVPVGLIRDMRAGRASYASREQHELLARRLKESGLLSQGKFDHALKQLDAIYRSTASPASRVVRCVHPAKQGMRT